MVATRNITDLNTLVTPQADDLLLIVERLSATSTEAKQITWANIQEAIQDIVGTLATSSSTVTFTYDDANGTLGAHVINNTSTQRSIYTEAGTFRSTRQEANFENGAGINVDVVDNSGDNRADITINNTGVVNAENNTVTGAVYELLSSVTVEADGSKTLELRPLKLGSNQLSATYSDTNQSITLDVVPGNIDINTLSAASPLSVTVGGTGASNAAAARVNLGAAQAGSNSDLTEITGLTTPLSIPQGGTGGSTAGSALYNLQGLKVLESVGSTGESLIADGSASVSNEYRGQLKTIRPFSNKIAVASSANNEVTIDVNADNVLAGATQAVNFNGQRLTNIGLPLSSTDAVNKEYADSVAQGLTVKESSRVATTSPFVSTYYNTVEVITAVDTSANTLTSNSHAFSNGDRVKISSIGGTVPGGLAQDTLYFVVGSTTNTFQLSATEGGSAISLDDTGSGTIQVAHTLYLKAGNNGALSIDGVTLNVNDRVLVQDQTNAFENGIYEVSATGSATTPAILTRAFDFNASAEMSSGSFTFVQEGNSNANIAFVQVTVDPIIDVDDIIFTQFSVANLQDGMVTNVKMADMEQATIKGRAAGAGTGAPVDLTANQTVAIINTATDAIDCGTF